MALVIGIEIGRGAVDLGNENLLHYFSHGIDDKLG